MTTEWLQDIGLGYN